MEKIIGTVKELYCYKEKGSKGEAADCLEFIEGKGIAGDCHADGSPRQLAILTTSEQKWMDEQEIKGFCFHKYKANLVFEGFSLNDLTPGKRLRVGCAVLEVSDASKKCPAELCALAKSGKACKLRKTHAFAVAAQSGACRPGDRVIESVKESF